MNQSIKNRLIGTIRALKPRKIMIVGDMMLDQYTWGEVGRISPEAPIPILTVRKEEFRLGGAANVAANIDALDCRAYPVGVVGTGSSGSRLIGILKKLKISSEGMVLRDSFRTIVKKRVLTEQQQLIRIDYENSDIDPDGFLPELRRKIDRLLPGMDAVVISDYAKGLFNRELLRSIIAEANALKIPLICDPGSGADYTRYRGVTTIKPNRHEAEQTAGMRLTDKQSILKAAGVLQEMCRSQFIALSLDRDGILLYRGPEEYQFVETDAQEVFDVTGAGDAVVGTMAVLLANGVDPERSVRIANVAAKLELSYRGVVAIPWPKIVAHLTTDDLRGKIVTLDFLVEEIEKDEDSPIVFTNGYFDRLSAGHMRFLIEAAKIPGKLVVAINSDRSVMNQKGSKPLLNERDRARLLASLESVYRVVVFDAPDASELIRRVKPRTVAKGERFRQVVIPEQEAIKAVGASIEYLQHFVL